MAETLAYRGDRNAGANAAPTRSAGGADGSHDRQRREGETADGRSPPPRSDIGTIFIHWTLVVAIGVSLATGLRWSVDAEGSVLNGLIGAYLPQGELWSWHVGAALVATFAMAAYGVYLTAARLRRRVALKRTVVLTMEVSPRLRCSAINVVLYWVLFALIAALFVTGVLLYLGYGGVVVDIHYVSALAVAGYVVAHVFSHAMYGGVAQLLRLFRPQKLRRYSGGLKWPLTVAVGAGLAAAGAAAFADLGTRTTLAIPRVDALPTLDGRLDDPSWRRAIPVRVVTQQGSNLGGSGESLVEIRAVRTGTHVAFAFRWQDPTRSLKRLPLIKRADGWHLLHNRADTADETAYYEDKFSVLFARTDAFGGGGTTHMGPKPLAGKPGALNKRGLHYTTDGSLADVWQWKASRGGMLGYMDDMWFGTPLPANAGQEAGTKRYSAGYGADEGTAFYIYNYVGQPPGGYRGPVQVRRLPKDYKATLAKLGAIDLAVTASDGDGAQWWMFKDETVPYSPAHDATIPVGTIIPGVLMMKPYSGSRADVRAGARWADGHWTLEVVRRLRTGKADDLDMQPGLFMWVAVFDHNQTRHTRHIRPVQITFVD